MEDHKPTCRVLVNLLLARHYEVQAASCVAEALILANQGDFDLLISDIGLPDGDGYQLMQQLRGERLGLPGIALTGYGMEEDVNRSQAAGFTTHLTKPVSVKALENALSLIGASPGAR